MLLLGLGCETPQPGYWEPVFPSDPPELSLIAAILSCTEQHGTSPPTVSLPFPQFEEYQSMESEAQSKSDRSWKAHWRRCMRMKGWLWVEEPRMFRPW